MENATSCNGGAELSMEDILRAKQLMEQCSYDPKPAVCLLPPGLMKLFCEEEGLTYSEDFVHNEVRYRVHVKLAHDMVVTLTDDFEPEDDVLKRWFEDE